MQYNISRLDLRFNHTTRRGQLIWLPCMRPPLSPTRPFPRCIKVPGTTNKWQGGGTHLSVHYLCIRPAIIQETARQADRPDRPDSQHNWIRGVLLPHRAWCVIAEGRTAYDSQDEPINADRSSPQGPALVGRYLGTRCGTCRCSERRTGYSTAPQFGRAPCSPSGWQIVCSLLLLVLVRGRPGEGHPIFARCMVLQQCSPTPNRSIPLLPLPGIVARPRCLGAITAAPASRRHSSLLAPAEAIRPHPA